MSLSCLVNLASHSRASVLIKCIIFSRSLWKTWINPERDSEEHCIIPKSLGRLGMFGHIMSSHTHAVEHSPGELVRMRIRGNNTVQGTKRASRLHACLLGCCSSVRAPSSLLRRTRVRVTDKYIYIYIYMSVANLLRDCGSIQRWIDLNESYMTSPNCLGPSRW